jgi:PEP-CTERM motif
MLRGRFATAAAAAFILEIAACVGTAKAIVLDYPSNVVAASGIVGAGIEAKFVVTNISSSTLTDVKFSLVGQPNQSGSDFAFLNEITYGNTCANLGTDAGCTIYLSFDTGQPSPSAGGGTTTWPDTIFTYDSYSQQPGGPAVAITVNAVPEPSTWAMMLICFAGLGFAGYRRTRRGAPVAG